MSFQLTGVSSFHKFSITLHHIASQNCTQLISGHTSALPLDLSKGKGASEGGAESASAGWGSGGGSTGAF